MRGKTKAIPRVSNIIAKKDRIAKKINFFFSSEGNIKNSSFIINVCLKY